MAVEILNCKIFIMICIDIGIVSYFSLRSAFSGVLPINSCNMIAGIIYESSYFRLCLYVGRDLNDITYLWIEITLFRDTKNILISFLLSAFIFFASTHLFLCPFSISFQYYRSSYWQVVRMQLSSCIILSHHISSISSIYHSVCTSKTNS